MNVLKTLDKISLLLQYALILLKNP